MISVPNTGVPHAVYVEIVYQVVDNLPSSFGTIAQGEAVPNYPNTFAETQGTGRFIDKGWLSQGGGYGAVISSLSLSVQRRPANVQDDLGQTIGGGTVSITSGQNAGPELQLSNSPDFPNTDLEPYYFGVSFDGTEYAAYIVSMKITSPYSLLDHRPTPKTSVTSRGFEPFHAAGSVLSGVVQLGAQGEPVMTGDSFSTTEIADVYNSVDFVAGVLN